MSPQIANANDAAGVVVLVETASTIEDGRRPVATGTEADTVEKTGEAVVEIGIGDDMIVYESVFIMLAQMFVCCARGMDERWFDYCIQTSPTNYTLVFYGQKQGYWVTKTLRGLCGQQDACRREPRALVAGYIGRLNNFVLPPSFGLPDFSDHRFVSAAEDIKYRLPSKNSSREH